LKIWTRRLDKVKTKLVGKKNEISDLKRFLDQKVIQFNNPDFIKDDPVCIPHLFSKKQDIEIAGFFAAVFAWGIRKTIINKSKFLLRRREELSNVQPLTHNRSPIHKPQCRGMNEPGQRRISV